MLTKDMERKALAKITKVLDELRADGESYVVEAFRGCEDAALSNIDNDFFDSPFGRMERLEHENCVLEENLEQADRGYRELEKMLKDEQNKYADTFDEVCELRRKWMDAEKKKAEQAQEILELKAKLYDLICKGE